MTTDEQLKLAVSVARGAARSGEDRRLDTLSAIVFRTLTELALRQHTTLHEPDRECEL